jgi:type I restriction enzyme R subunit
VRENMSEEELVIFDILTRPAPELSSEERTEVKKAARELLARLKVLLVLNWRQKSAARSQLKLTIEDTLDTVAYRVPTRRSSTTRNARRCSSMCLKATPSETRGFMPEIA